MATSADGPEAQDALFEKPESQNTPHQLTRATLRLQFPPTYIVVGAYRLFTDPLLFVPAWDKCRHGVRRGAIVGAVWAVLTFGIQKKFIEVFLANSPRVVGLTNNTMFGFKIPFNVHTYAAVLLVSQQVTELMRFFLSRNIRIARDRAWAQTVQSRGKDASFWGPYIEEWSVPPVVDNRSLSKRFSKLFKGRVGIFVLRRIVLMPFHLYPVVGTLVSAWFKALSTAEYLHRPYFQAKNMTTNQIDVFVEERKWDYRLFGFTAALVEGLPIVGLFFSISDRVGAAMWAHDLEKRQHFVGQQQEIAVSKRG